KTDDADNEQTLAPSINLWLAFGRVRAEVAVWNRDRLERTVGPARFAPQLQQSGSPRPARLAFPSRFRPLRTSCLCKHCLLDPVSDALFSMWSVPCAITTFAGIGRGFAASWRDSPRSRVDGP